MTCDESRSILLSLKGSGFCSTASNGLHHPDLLDCTQYYNCWNGAGELKGCPDAQYFTTKYNGYDHADRVECNVGSTNAPSTSGPIQPPASTAAPTTSGPTQPPVSTSAQTQSPTTQSTPGKAVLFQITSFFQNYQSVVKKTPQSIRNINSLI